MHCSTARSEWVIASARCAALNPAITPTLCAGLPDERQRRFYRLTPESRRVLAAQRSHWAEFVDAIKRITEKDHA